MAEYQNRELLRQATLKIGLAEFVERTTNHRLDTWQQDLCARLETLAYTKRRRLLIHAPPQMGKSIIVSQRFPAWLLTRKPYHRVKLACYNVTHATRFGKIVRDLMQEDDFARLFPDPSLRLPRISSADEWSTLARSSTRDSQPSFKALGLATGFVGQGVDTLLIDDPYADPKEAYSPVINAKVRSFWTDTARPRLNDDTNVVVMFHRYCEPDLAGYLMETEPDEWELIRYAARADGDYEHPTTHRIYKDPMSRPIGERLSPRYSDEWFDLQAANEWVWLSQFQGRPTAKEGSFFKVTKLQYCEPSEVPDNLRKIRAWDLAASKNGDWTAGVLIGKADNSRYYILDVVRGRWLPDDRDKEMLDTANADGKGVKIRLAKDPAQAGVDQKLRLTRLLDGYSVRFKPVSGDKITRAEGFASAINNGNVTIVRSVWQHPFVEELRQFPLGGFDDQVDAAVDAYDELAARRVITAA
jgi:predicted phage terminase large subunit-like protein